MGWPDPRAAPCRSSGFRREAGLLGSPHIAPLKYANWAEYRTGVQKMFFEPNRSLKFTLKDDLRIHRRGQLAWATFTFGADVVNKQGANSHLDGRWTLLLEQRKSRWVVVHEHVSVPLGGS